MGNSVPQSDSQTSPCGAEEHHKQDRLLQSHLCQTSEKLHGQKLRMSDFECCGSVLLLHSAREELTTKYFGFSMECDTQLLLVP